MDISVSPLGGGTDMHIVMLENVWCVLCDSVHTGLLIYFMIIMDHACRGCVNYLAYLASSSDSIWEASCFCDVHFNFYDVLSLLF